MAKNGDLPASERIAYLEEELKMMKKQARSLTEQILGSVVILCLPLPQGKRLEIAFKQIEILPNSVLGVIARRYILESGASDLSFGAMLSPLVGVLGFERAWKIVEMDHLRGAYGDYAVLRWEEMAKGHPCEG